MKLLLVEIYAAGRRFVFIEGKSRREAARVFGLSRDTIAKMCRRRASRPTLQAARILPKGAAGNPLYLKMIKP
jgi:hypothetical protein